MAHLLHIDSSIQGDRSVSRKLTARAAGAWRQAHPDGSVRYRDLGANPIPHLDAGTGTARMIPPELRTDAQKASWTLSEELVGEIEAADTVLLGMPLYNYGAPSTVKAWVDHLIAPGLAIDTTTGKGLLGGRQFIVVATRGGSYGTGARREGWDHASAWLPHGLSKTGLEPQFVEVELTLAKSDPAMSHLVPRAEASLRIAEQQIDALWDTRSSADQQAVTVEARS
ncbi:FMN-dependent NADH-azoreductase [Cellulomonas sp. Y8]|uniref:FMN-dependent NADH-azoreductase n=1 Tax=Cellulomonas sp. Y8 TaxID=2591145 RepID=UPI003D719EF8